MPIYIYEHPKTKERKEVVQRMQEEHVFIDECGVPWDRVFEAPRTAIDTLATLNPFDRAGFVKRTAKAGMTLGEMYDESARLSQRRAAVGGQDPIKSSAIKEYESKTKKPHPHS